MNDVSGPVILWQDYGTEGWCPLSFDSAADALSFIQEAGTTEAFVVTRLQVLTADDMPDRKRGADAMLAERAKEGSE